MFLFCKQIANVNVYISNTADRQRFIMQYLFFCNIFIHNVCLNIQIIIEFINSDKPISIIILGHTESFSVQICATSCSEYHLILSSNLVNIFFLRKILYCRKDEYLKQHVRFN